MIRTLYTYFMSDLTIRDLWITVDQKKIIQGLNLEIKEGSVHVLMGMNGSGKTTIAHVLAGQPGYTVDSGTVTYKGQDLLSLPPEKRAHLGLFLSFQHPIEIPGVSTITFLKTAFNSMRQARGENIMDAVEFLNYVKARLKLVNFDDSFLYRSINEGFSGGEKKRSEILQMAVLEPSFAILDEVDSGLDIDSLKVVAQGVNQLRSSKRTLLIITHYPRLLHYIKPDHVHILHNGKIVRSGDIQLANELEKQGYDPFIT